MADPSPITTVVGPLAGAFAALAGSFITLGHARRTQRAQQLYDAEIQAKRWDREDRLRQIANRERVYAEFLTYADEVAMAPHADVTFDAAMAGLRSITQRLEHVRLLGSAEAVVVAEEIAGHATSLAVEQAPERRDQLVRLFADARRRFVSAGRLDLGTELPPRAITPA